jgi:2',3'-cyclic-nucleotide 2'-phosphodiesterase (5'-nucleotidase family)
MLQYNLRRVLWLPLLVLFAFGCKNTAVVTKHEVSIIAVDTIIISKDDSVSASIIAPYKQKIEAEMKQVIGYTTQAMDKGKPEGLLNNFIADIILRKANEYYKASDGREVDMCLLNTGGFRSSLPKGAIVKSNIFDLMPFDNKLVVLTISGDRAQEMFNFIVSKGGEPISGFTMGIKDTLAVNIIIKDKTFDKSKTYKVVTSDYLANGGDKMFFFNNPIKTEEVNQLVRDMIIEYFIEENNKGNKLDAKLDKRIYYEQ